MSTFLTPPVWYDKNGNLVEMLSGAALPAGEGNPLTNLAIGKNSVAGTSNGSPSHYGTAVGYNAKANNYSIALGGETLATSGIAIGYQASVIGSGVGIAGTVDGSGIGIRGSVTGNGIGIEGRVTGSGIGIGGNATGGGIGIGGDAAAGKIQLGSSTQTYELTVGNGRMSLNIGSTVQSNWISAKSNGISQGLYLVKYWGDNYICLVYLMAPIAFTDPGGSTSINDWYFPFKISPLRLTIGDAHPVVADSYYLKVDKTSTASNLKITPGYYRYDSGTLNTFVNMADGEFVMLFKIL